MKNKVSENFTRKELKCKCNCGFDSADIELLEVLQKIREFYKKPVSVHCANRCLQHNRSVGSKDTSKHIRGIAADFNIDGIDNQFIFEYLSLMYPETYGIGIYDWGIHVDIRTEKSRWDERTK